MQSSTYGNNPNDSAWSRHHGTPLIAVLGLMALALSAGCTNPLLVKASHVAITAVPKKIGSCTVIGLVYPDDDARGDTFEDHLQNLRIATVRRGGNTLLMSSPGTSADGVAYNCNPPIRPDSDG